jgi:hypothetical protein
VVNETRHAWLGSYYRGAVVRLAVLDDDVFAGDGDDVTVAADDVTPVARGPPVAAVVSSPVVVCSPDRFSSTPLLSSSSIHGTHWCTHHHHTQ